MEADSTKSMEALTIWNSKSKFKF